MNRTYNQTYSSVILDLIHQVPLDSFLYIGDAIITDAVGEGLLPCIEDFQVPLDKMHSGTYVLGVRITPQFMAYFKHKLNTKGSSLSLFMWHWSIEKDGIQYVSATDRDFIEIRSGLELSSDLRDDCERYGIHISNL